MTAFTRRPSLRWLVPLLAAVLLLSAGSVAGVLTASARGALPARSASQLLLDVSKARLDGLSGTIVQNADLGLPSIPGMSGGGSSEMTSLVSGSHTLRLWYAGPNRVRLALLGSLGESDLVRNGTDFWTWSSTNKTATHRSLPLSGHDTPRSLAQAAPVTPQQAADTALRAISPTTKVTTDGTAVVAGRNAYELVLQPKDAGSLVDSVHIAIDAKTHIPTRVQVFAKGAGDPSFEVGFTSFDPSTPAKSAFRFNPPPGTKVTESGKSMESPKSGLGTRKPKHHHATGATGASGAGARPQVVGTGWASVVVAKVPHGATGSNQVKQMLAVLPQVSGSWGSGRLLRGTLFSAVLTDDGRVAMGAVAPEGLYAALAHR